MKERRRPDKITNELGIDLKIKKYIAWIKKKINYNNEKNMTIKIIQKIFLENNL